MDKHSISTDIELIAVEFHKNKRKWLSLCVYKPPNQNDSVFVEAISAITNEYSAQYERIVIFDDAKNITKPKCQLKTPIFKI